MSISGPDIAQRLRDAVKMLPLALLILFASRVLFDLLAGRPMFWSSMEVWEAFLWNSLITGPFILFALMVAAQRNSNSRK
ncbi:MAG: hypothetical protein JWM36_2914 [Hyphomicrobiales bacterium]|nr:hypothetical protein [Hyphomicrobiales bacterium]